MTKRLLLILLSVLCLASAVTPVPLAEEGTSTPLSAEVTVNIINNKPVLAAEKITVTDTDGDGALTISDALYCAHEKKYTGGAAAGYQTEPSQYGLSLIKLWGNVSGSYGYYLNNASPMSLLDTVKDGDNVTAFVYQDTTYYSDSYSYFDKLTATITEGESVTLNLSYLSLDYETWETTVNAAEGATVTVNGETTAFKVDKDGNVSVKLTMAGTYLISATSDLNIVAPVCVVTVEKAPTFDLPSDTNTTEEDTTSYGWMIAICAAVVCSATAVAVAISNKNGKKK